MSRTVSQIRQKCAPSYKENPKSQTEIQKSNQTFLKNKAGRNILLIVLRQRCNELTWPISTT